MQRETCLCTPCHQCHPARVTGLVALGGLGFKEKMSTRSSKILKTSQLPTCSFYLQAFLWLKRIAETTQVPKQRVPRMPCKHWLGKCWWGTSRSGGPGSPPGRQPSLQYSQNFYLLDEMAWMEFTWCQAAPSLGPLQPGRASPSQQRGFSLSKDTSCLFLALFLRSAL